MPALSDEWIREQLQLCAKATPGPWCDGFDDGSGRIGDRDGAYITLAEAAHPEERFPTVIVGGDYEGIPQGVLKQQDVDFLIAAREGYPLTLRLLKETRALLGLVLLELDHMVAHNPECLCDEDCQEQARELLNRHEKEAADES